MRIMEIFKSFHGECNGHHQGRIVTFIRTAGCNLACYYCDTKNSQKISNGTEMSIDEIMQKVKKLKTKHICITGGEPLIQIDISKLLSELRKEGFIVSIETNGTKDIYPYLSKVDSFVVDYKGISTGYSEKMLNCNFETMRKSDVLKFVIALEEDYNQALKLTKSLSSSNLFSAIIAFSPVDSYIDAYSLGNRMINDNIDNVVLSVQIHKLINFQ